MDGLMRREMGIDVLIRTHMPSRLHELDRALFSLALQTFSPIHPIILAQDFGPSDLGGLRTLVSKHRWCGGVSRPRIIGVESEAGRDIRSRLLNIGLADAESRFVAFLDSDDYLYAHAYAYLVSEAMNHKAAIAFGNIVVKHLRVFENHVFHTATVRNVFEGSGLADLFAGNFCPIHSFVIDRSIVPDSELYLDEDLVRLEHYDLLLRLCSRFPARFESRIQNVGVYNRHADDPKPIRVEEADAERKAANEGEWSRAMHKIDLRKSELRRELDARSESAGRMILRHLKAFRSKNT